MTTVMTQQTTRGLYLVRPRGTSRTYHCSSFVPFLLRIVLNSDCVTGMEFTKEFLEAPALWTASWIFEKYTMQHETMDHCANQKKARLKPRCRFHESAEPMLTYAGEMVWQKLHTRALMTSKTNDISKKGGNLPFTISSKIIFYLLL